MAGITPQPFATRPLQIARTSGHGLSSSDGYDSMFNGNEGYTSKSKDKKAHEPASTFLESLDFATMSFNITWWKLHLFMN